MRNAYIILVALREGKRKTAPGEYHIKVDVREALCMTVDWNHLFHGTDPWREMVATLTVVVYVYKIAKSDYWLCHVCLSVHIEGLGSHWTNLIFEHLSKICRDKFRFYLTRITGTLHEDQHTFFIISRSVILRMRNVWNKICKENQDIRFVFNNFYSKIVPFMR